MINRHLMTFGKAYNSDARSTQTVTRLCVDYFLVIFILQCCLHTVGAELEVQNVFNSLHAQRYSTLHKFTDNTPHAIDILHRHTQTSCTRHLRMSVYCNTAAKRLDCEYTISNVQFCPNTSQHCALPFTSCCLTY